jgi:hypothetical protein
METIEFEGKTLLINPGGQCPECEFRERCYSDEENSPNLQLNCAVENCNFILKEDGKPV